VPPDRRRCGTITATAKSTANPRPHLATPDFVEEALRTAARQEGMRKASRRDRPDKAAVSRSLKPAWRRIKGSNTNSHYSIVDKRSKCSCPLPTAERLVGARVTAAGTGLLLNERDGRLHLRAAVPTCTVWLHGEQNRARPAAPAVRRCRHHRDKTAPWLVVGTAGRSPHHHARRSAYYHQRIRLRH